MKYNIAFYKDIYNKIYFIIIPEDSLTFFAGYVDSDITVIESWLEYNLHSTCNNIMDIECIFKDNDSIYIGQHVNITFDELLPIIEMYR